MEIFVQNYSNMKSMNYILYLKANLVRMCIVRPSSQEIVLTWNYMGLVWFMGFNATFNNISVLSVEETEVPANNHRPFTSH